MARTATPRTNVRDAQIDDMDLHFRELLDHIAVELAEEYVRLMDAAAKADTDNQHVEEG